MSNRKHPARDGKCEAVEHELGWGVLFCRSTAVENADCIWGTECVDDDVIGHRHQLCYTHYAQLMAYQN